MFDIDTNIGDKDFLLKIEKKIAVYENECIKKKENSSPTKIKKMIEEHCHEN